MDLGGLDEPTLRRLIGVGRSLVARLDLEGVLDGVLDAARELTGARYAALGVLDERKQELDRFLTLGIDEETHRLIGDLPRGHGVLGELIRVPQPLRLRDVASHPRSYGFPVGHPPMHTFLGVPIEVRGEGWGNLYLTEKEGGVEFTATDEAAVIVLAGWAAIAIENARLYGGLARRRDDVEEGIALIDVEIDNLASLIAELRPAALDQIGLAPALRTLAERRARESGVAIDVLVRLDTAGGGERLPAEIESTVYRLVQEALNNVVKHAAATRAEAVLERRGDTVEVTVRDDGQGFDPAAVSGGFGLIGMRERVELTGGELHVDVAAGSGTTVRASIPLERSHSGLSSPRSST